MGVELPRFGPFCLVVTDPAAHADAIAVFPSDSAQRYTSDAGDVDRERARREAAPWHHRGSATTIGRAADVGVTLRPAWPWLICNPQRYVEVVVAPGPPLASVDVVRVRDAYLDRLADLTLEGSEDPLEAATEQPS